MPFWLSVIFSLFPWNKQFCISPCYAIKTFGNRQWHDFKIHRIQKNFLYYLYDCVKNWSNKINLVFGKEKNNVIGEKINLGKKINYRTLKHFVVSVYFQKLNPTQTILWISQKEIQNVRLFLLKGLVVGWKHAFSMHWIAIHWRHFFYL